MVADSRSWIGRLADDVETHALRSHDGDATIVCATGISPSGVIHLGNLRELITVHLVAEELRHRGRTVDHLHSWDDFDRLRKLPPGAPGAFAEHVGKPLCDVPDPGGEFPSFAARHIVEFERSVEVLGMRPRYIRQSEAYRRGDYAPAIRVALQARLEVFDILAEHQTESLHQMPAAERRARYYPLKVYCRQCHHDETTVVDYDDARGTVSYTCSGCSSAGELSLTDRPLDCKLPWKVDWPMRWAHEAVDFEPAGEDHSAPGSSRMVGQRIVSEIFGRPPPLYAGYGFVGLSGASSKMSSSRGNVATPATATTLLEPPMVRWLYARRLPQQAFSIDLRAAAVQRLYDEWDQFAARVEAGNAGAVDRELHRVSVASSEGEIAASRLRVPFRVLGSAADITQGNREQICRIAAQHLANPVTLEEIAPLLEPRLTCAITWAGSCLEEEERTHVRERFDDETWRSLDPATRSGVEMLNDQIGGSWSLPALTHLVYSVPKRLLGLPDDTAPTPDLKRAQRTFFAALYRLLCGSETGPRLPTLFLSIGVDRVRELLTAREQGA